MGTEGAVQDVSSWTVNAFGDVGDAFVDAANWTGGAFTDAYDWMKEADNWEAMGKRCLELLLPDSQVTGKAAGTCSPTLICITATLMTISRQQRRNKRNMRK